MYEIGDYVVYGSNGVCKVMAYGLVDHSGIPSDREYYTLRPYYAPNSTIYAPVEGPRMILRPIISKEGALELVESLRSLEVLDVEDDAMRLQGYRRAFLTCDCLELAQVLKTIWKRTQGRMAEGKKATSEDDKYFRMAEECFYGEMAVAMELDKEGVRAHILEKVGTPS